jgi:hypothetical protein
VPHAWHSPHRPTHFGACQPHSVHRKAAVDFAMAAPYRQVPTFGRGHRRDRPGARHKLGLTTNE